MKFVLFIFVALFVFYSCSSDVSYSSDAYESVLNNRIKNREISGELAFPNAFTPTSIKVFELDSNLNRNKKIDAEFDTVRNTFNIEYRSYASRYLLIVASGRWKNYDSTGYKVEFETITDIAVVEDKVRLRLLSHLEIPRVKQLMKEGYPFMAAKEKAVRELSVYWEQFAHTNFSESLIISEKWNEYFPYMSFFYGGTDSAFVENIEKFRNSFAGGVWQDSVERIKSADYLLKNYYGLNEIMINWTLNKVEKRYVLDYISNLLSFTYNLPLCSFNGQTFQIKNSLSEFYGDSVVCEQLVVYNYLGYDVYRFGRSGMLMRPFTNLEKQLGICVYDSAAKSVIKEYDGSVYECNHPGRSGIPDSSNVENWKRKESDG